MEFANGDSCSVVTSVNAPMAVYPIIKTPKGPRFKTLTLALVEEQLPFLA